MKNYLNHIALCCFTVLVFNCANRGTPSGGEKDITPPVILKSEPENYNTNFNGKEIRIYFNEYVKLHNLQKQLIISPPMDPQPEILPLGSTSKYITIKIHDTLQPNTTYAFNFGNSIVDNNENNPFSFYKYVFSTGDYIDSLQVKGNIKDALARKTDDFVSVMLYQIDSTFNDSIIYKKVPRYVTNTLDSTTAYTIENVKAGTYLLMALKDENNDNKFQQKTDKIGFYKQFISLPTDSIYNLTLFKEQLDFKPNKPRLISGEKIAFGYQGNPDNYNIKLTSKLDSAIVSRVTKDLEKDSLYYWYKPRLTVDSLTFKTTHPSIEKIVSVKIKDQKRDTLSFNMISERTLNFNDAFKLHASIPYNNINTNLITILDQDSSKVNFTTKLDTLLNVYEFNFNKTEGNKYKIQALPEAFEDFFGNKNDTLNFNVSTKTKDDYGNIQITLNNATYPVIVELINDRNQVKYTTYSSTLEPIDFVNIKPGKYYMRVIFDSNKNKLYDPGNYLKKQQAERVSHFPTELDVRAGWVLFETFTLK